MPAGALFRKGDIWNVFAVVDGRAEARAVTLLRRSGRLAAVSSGGPRHRLGEVAFRRTGRFSITGPYRRTWSFDLYQRTGPQGGY